MQNLTIFFLTFLMFAFINPLQARASGHSLLKRVAVFPVKVEKRYRSEADKAWWSIREELTRAKRFSVASRLFLQKKEVFQARDVLEPVDAIVLGKLLEAHAIITCFAEDRQLKMVVYSGRTGRELWKYSLFIDPDIPFPIQLAKKSKQLMKAFIAAIPYQGYQILASELGVHLVTEGDVRIARVELGENHKVEVGQAVQWVGIKRSSLKPLFQQGGDVSILAEGRVLSVDRRIAQVEVLRYRNLSDLVEQSLLRFPDEVKRLRSSYALSKEPLDQLLRQVGHMQEREKKEPEKKPLASALSFIGSLALLIVLAL